MTITTWTIKEETSRNRRSTLLFLQTAQPQSPQEGANERNRPWSAQGSERGRTKGSNGRLSNLYIERDRVYSQCGYSAMSSGFSIHYTRFPQTRPTHETITTHHPNAHTRTHMTLCYGGTRQEFHGQLHCSTTVMLWECCISGGTHLFRWVPLFLMMMIRFEVCWLWCSRYSPWGREERESCRCHQPHTHTGWDTIHCNSFIDYCGGTRVLVYK